MTIVDTEDTRNIEWRNNNVGLSLLQKMGYKDGEGIGKRNQNNTALRALKRKPGLGLGAKIESEGGNSESSNHFSSILANLQVHHKTSTSRKSKKKKSKLTLPQNKVTATGHASKMRQAKFGEKSAEEMACIFGNTSFPVLNVKETEMKEKKKKKKRSREEEKSAEEEKIEKKVRKEERKRRKEEKKKKDL
jgi:hypothetical protein